MEFSHLAPKLLCQGPDLSSDRVRAALPPLLGLGGGSDAAMSSAQPREEQGLAVRPAGWRTEFTAEGGAGRSGKRGSRGTAVLSGQMTGPLALGSQPVMSPLLPCRALSAQGLRQAVAGSAALGAQLMGVVPPGTGDDNTGPPFRPSGAPFRH